MPGFSPPAYEIPAGGDLVISCWSAACASQSPDIRVKNSETDATIEGEIVRRMDHDGGGWLVFRPATPLVAETLLSSAVQIPGSENYEAQDFRVVVPEPFDIKTIMPMSSVTPFVVPSGALHCCESTVCPECAPMCFGDNNLVRASVNVGFAPTASLSQYLFQGTFVADGFDPIVSDLVTWRDSVSVLVSEASPSFCFVITAESIADGTRIEVAHDCVASQVTVGEQQTTRFEREEVYRECFTPLEGFEDEWCETWRSRCGPHGDLKSSGPLCVSADTLCNGSRGDAGGALRGDAGAEPLHEGDGTLCSVGMARHRARWLSLPWWIALTFFFRRVRRTRRPA